MVNREKNIAQWYIQSKTNYMYIQHFDPMTMSSYPGLPFDITVDNCSYQLIIRASSLRMNLYTRFLITALLSGTWYSTNMVEALQYLGCETHYCKPHEDYVYLLLCNSANGRAESSKQSQLHFSGTHVKFPQ